MLDLLNETERILQKFLLDFADDEDQMQIERDRLTDENAR